jgi:hypothetical protein
MPTSTRVAVAIVFIAIMALVVKPFVHAVVDLGFIPWLFMMGGLFWIAIKIENRDRMAAERPSYSWYDVGQDARYLAPIAAFWGFFVLAIFILTRFI